jgi:DNA-binding MarR family transcriptional regulator
LGSIIAFLHICDEECVAIKELAHRYGYSESSMSRFVHALTDAGPQVTRSPAVCLDLVAITTHPSDLRRRLVCLTAEGRRLRAAVQASLQVPEAQPAL